jgi:hypothetical protein
MLLLPAGVGLATLRACLRLVVGVPPARSGVFSAGNGPAMRAAIIGVCLGHTRERLRAHVRIATRITHTDPKAERAHSPSRGPLTVASRDENVSPAHYLATFRELLTNSPSGEDGGNDVHDAANSLLTLLERAADSVARGENTEVFAANGLGLPHGVSG